MRRDIVEAEPDLIVFGDPVSDRWRAAIEPEYVYVGEGTRLVLVRAGDAGQGDAGRVRKAADYDPDDEWARPPPREPLPE